MIFFFNIVPLIMEFTNRIAKELERMNPQWDAETIYQETRKIVTGELCGQADDRRASQVDSNIRGTM
jgi:hypothetical protein